MHEVYYGKDGKQSSYILNPTDLSSTDCIQGLAWILDKTKEALNKPTLPESDFECDTE